MIRNIIPLLLLLASCSHGPDPLEERRSWKREGWDNLALVEDWAVDTEKSTKTDVYILTAAVPDSAGKFTLQAQYWLPASAVVPLGDSSNTAGKASEQAVVTQLRDILRAFNRGEAALFFSRRDSLYHSMQPFASFMLPPEPIPWQTLRRMEKLLQHHGQQYNPQQP